MKEGAVLIRSIVLAKDKKVKEAVELLKKFTTEKVDDQMKLKLTAVQLLLSQVSALCHGARKIGLKSK